MYNILDFDQFGHISRHLSKFHAAAQPTSCAVLFCAPVVIACDWCLQFDVAPDSRLLTWALLCSHRLEVDDDMLGMFLAGILGVGLIATISCAFLGASHFA